MSPPPPRAVLFDWDNTLVDNWACILDALNATLEAMGHAPWTFEESRERVFRSAREGFPDLFGPRWREARTLFYDHFTARHLETLKPLPGAAALLEGLARAGIYAGVVSNKRGDLLRREAAHLGWLPFFGRIVGADDAKADKPDVAPVELALAGSGVARGPSVWFVGDNAVDVRCARNAGCVAVLVGASADSASADDRPDLHVANCDALAKLVGEL